MNPVTSCLPRLLLAALLVLALTGCSPRQLIVQGIADQLAAQDPGAEEDLVLLKEASPFYLKLSESVLRQDAGHLGLATAVAAGFTQYAYAFVAFEADRLDSLDAKAAQVLRERAAKLYRRARDHALAALEQRLPGFAQALASPQPEHWPAIERDLVPLAYWGAAAWGGLISLAKDDPDTVADLPLAIRLAGLAWAAEPHYGDGALASLMGSFEAARPGGSRQLAAQYFDQATNCCGTPGAAAYLARAEGLALPAGDKNEFVRLLQLALASPPAKPALQDQIMRQRARWLLSAVDDLF